MIDIMDNLHKVHYMKRANDKKIWGNFNNPNPLINNKDYKPNKLQLF